MLWSYVIALVTCAFITPIAATVMAYAWAAGRYETLMAHGGAPSGTEYMVMLAGMVLVMGLGLTFITVVVALCTGTAKAVSSRGRVATACVITVATAWFAFPVYLMTGMLPSSLPDPDRGQKVGAFVVLVGPLVWLWVTTRPRGRPTPDHSGDRRSA